MRAIITDEVHPILITRLEEKGVACTYMPKMEQLELESIIKDFEILVINSKIQVNEAFIAQAENLKIVGRLGSGLEIIDLAYAASKGILVVNSPEGNRDAVGEHAIAMLLSLFNHVNASHLDVINFDWHREARRGEELKGKTIGILGFGNTGKALAKKLSGFDVEVIFYDKYLINEKSIYAQQVNLESIYKEADIISLHLPYNEGTHYLFSNDFIDKMRKPFYLINTSRGKVVNTADLLKGIKASKVSGACLDVFENEKTSTYSEEEKHLIIELNQSNKVIFSPHVAGWTHQSKYKLAEIIGAKIVNLL